MQVWSVKQAGSIVRGPSEVPKEIRDAARFHREKIAILLDDPLAAFVATWKHRRGKLLAEPTDPNAPFQETPRGFRKRFAFDLNFRCTAVGRGKWFDLRGSNLDALDIYLNTLSELLESWRPLVTYNDSIVLWTEQPGYEDHLERMQRAQEARIAWHEPPDMMAKLEMKRAALVPVERFRGQRTYSQAAKTAAYTPWADFLTGNPRLLRFCERCGKPFERNRSNQQYCDKRCNNFASSNRAHGSTKRKKNWENLQKASLKLSKRPSGANIKNALNGILSVRWIDWWMKAANNPENREARERLVGLCFIGEDNQGISKEQQVREALEKFLQDIVRIQP